MPQPLRRGEAYRANWTIRRLQLSVLSLSGRFPPLERLLLHMWKNYRLLTYKLRLKLLAASGTNEIDVDKTIWVDPESIIYSSLKEFDIYRDKGGVIGGDWDRLDKRFEDLDIYVAFKERFVEGKDWADTAFYQRVLHEIINGKSLWRCRNKVDLDRRCENLDSLFQNIKSKGYKSQSEIISQENTRDELQSEDEIAVNIGRDGDLLFNNGAHRLAIVKLLGIPNIPIKITARHAQWVNFRREILLYAEDQPSGKIYSPITHPDLQDIPATHDQESDRFDIIQANLSTKKGHLLDIGAHWGYYCHKFEEIGFNCYAVENDRMHLYFLQKLKRAENRKFEILSKSIFECPEVENLHFDVVLSLNIFHHFLKEKDSYLKLLHLLKNLKMKEMYFEPHQTNAPQMQGAYKNYSEEEFVEFILQTSRLNRADCIGRARDGRGIYKIY
jgi:2-polyprenyl-3-methyl-5-hydroxy-6-metoxy-1,4-benzoquinol methylase